MNFQNFKVTLEDRDKSRDNLAEKCVYGLEVGEANSDISNDKKPQSTKTTNFVQKNSIVLLRSCFKKS